MVHYCKNTVFLERGGRKLYFQFHQNSIKVKVIPPSSLATAVLFERIECFGKVQKSMTYWKLTHVLFYNPSFFAFILYIVQSLFFRLCQHQLEASTLFLSVIIFFYFHAQEEFATRVGPLGFTSRC